MGSGAEYEKKIDAQIKRAQEFGLNIDRVRAAKMVDHAEKNLADFREKWPDRWEVMERKEAERTACRQRNQR